MPISDRWDRAVIESPMGFTSNRLMYFSFDQEPFDLTYGGTDEEFMETVFSNDKLAAFYLDESLHQLRIQIVNTETLEELSSETYSFSKEDNTVPITKEWGHNIVYHGLTAEKLVGSIVNLQ